MPDESGQQAHDGKIAIGDIATRDGPAEAGVPKARYVHYPGAQQLILWLPRPGHQGYETLSLSRDGVEIDRAAVMDRLNGSLQILLDTLLWSPGEYLIAISHADGWRHEVRLSKLLPDVEPPVEPTAPPVDMHPPERNAAGGIIYRDGLGNVIPDLDLDMHDAALRELARKFTRRLEYEGSFRAGVIHYVDGETRIRFYHEMCGGEMKFSIDVPPAESWEKATGAPLSLRDEIVAFVAERVQRDKSPTWRFEITDRSIDFY